MDGLRLGSSDKKCIHVRRGDEISAFIVVRKGGAHSTFGRRWQPGFSTWASVEKFGLRGAARLHGLDPSNLRRKIVAA